MPLSKEEVQHTARLARLRFSDEETERLADEMSRILDYIEKLSELDTTGVPPMAHALALSNVFRADEPEEALSREEAFQNASDTDGDYIRVPKVIE